MKSCNTVQPLFCAVKILFTKHVAAWAFSRSSGCCGRKRTGSPERMNTSINCGIRNSITSAVSVDTIELRPSAGVFQGRPR